MNNFEKELIEFIQTLEPQMAEQLTQWVEWEKELSWSNGYADAVDQLEEKSEKRFGNVGESPDLYRVIKEIIYEQPLYQFF